MISGRIKGHKEGETVITDLTENGGFGHSACIRNETKSSDSFESYIEKCYSILFYLFFNLSPRICVQPGIAACVLLLLD